VDDRTDDCAFGAMMSLALRQKFRKLRFQMIADNSCTRNFRVIHSYTSARCLPRNRCSSFPSKNARICSELNFLASDMPTITPQHPASSFRPVLC